MSTPEAKARKKARRQLRLAVAKSLEPMIATRYPLHRQPTTNQIRAMAKQISRDMVERERKQSKQERSS